ncbi:MAG: leucine-rich repeat domain-containing protein [Simkaniaceae bacterium]|nr:leucine-rich repeat domain-containing protein [Simkaniaceae bacterium]
MTANIGNLELLRFLRQVKGGDFKFYSGGLTEQEDKLNACIENHFKFIVKTTVPEDHLTFDLRAIPPQIGRFENLREFSFQSHEGSVIPKEIGDLKNLEVLNLNFPMDHLPSEIGNLQALKVLKVGSKMLKALPESIGALKALEEFRVSAGLTEFPLQIRNLKNLKVVDLRFNTIANFPVDVCGLERLEDLQLFGNPLNHDFKPEGFCYLSWELVVKYLRLSQDQQNSVHGKVYQLSIDVGIAVDTTNPEWGKDHAFDSRDILFRALPDQEIRGE